MHACNACDTAVLFFYRYLVFTASARVKYFCDILQVFTCQFIIGDLTDAYHTFV